MRAEGRSQIGQAAGEARTREMIRLMACALHIGQHVEAPTPNAIVRLMTRKDPEPGTDMSAGLIG